MWRVRRDSPNHLILIPLKSTKIISLHMKYFVMCHCGYYHIKYYMDGKNSFLINKTHSYRRRNIGQFKSEVKTNVRCCVGIVLGNIVWKATLLGLRWHRIPIQRHRKFLHSLMEFVSNKHLLVKVYAKLHEFKS